MVHFFSYVLGFDFPVQAADIGDAPSTQLHSGAHERVLPTRTLLAGVSVRGQ